MRTFTAPTVIATLLMAASQHSVWAVQKLQIACPLQALTIWDPETKEQAAIEGPTRRFRFLPRFRVGLQAEANARKELAENRLTPQQVNAASKDWAKNAASSERNRRDVEERIVEQAYDQAVKEFDNVAAMNNFRTKKNANKYQFVGVVNSSSGSSSEGSKPPITWYARKKPAHAKWSLRLVHVNRDAIIKDLFNRGKVDIFAKYDNTGAVDEKTKQPIVHAKYIVRQRSWKNLWNFSPKHFFTDSSGMYWRERRLRPGMYTDGSTVYESTYRYRDGRNGMKRLSSFQEFLNSRSIDASKKEKIVKRLKEDSPDIVLED